MTPTGISEYYFKPIVEKKDASTQTDETVDDLYKRVIKEHFKEEWDVKK